MKFRAYSRAVILRAAQAICCSVLLLTLTGCFRQFYKTGTVVQTNSQTLQQLKGENKFFILHTGDSARAIQIISISDEMVEAETATLIKEHSQGLSPEPGDETVMRKKYKEAVLNEVHLYVPASQTEIQGHVSIPIDSISRMDVNTFNQKATTRNHIWSGVGIGLATATGILIWAASTVSFDFSGINWGH